MRNNPLESRLTAQWYFINLQSAKSDLEKIIQSANNSLTLIKKLEEDEYNSLELFEQSVTDICDDNDVIDTYVNALGRTITRVYEQADSDGFII